MCNSRPTADCRGQSVNRPSVLGNGDWSLLVSEDIILYSGIFLENILKYQNDHSHKSGGAILAQ